MLDSCRCSEGSETSEERVHCTVLTGMEESSEQSCLVPDCLRR